MTTLPNRLLATGLALWVIAAPLPARAGDLTPGQLRRLAVRAADDPAALRRLRRADTVGGRQVNLREPLSGVRAVTLAARLEALADGAGAADAHIGPRRAQDDARSILAGSAFRPEVFPRPLAGVLRRIGVWLAPLYSRVTVALAWIAARIPGGRATLWAVLAGVVVLAAATLAGRVARRSPAGRDIGTPGRARDGGAPDPARLERMADEAARAGDAEGSVRLRFTAGLLRLGGSGVIAYHPSITAGEIRRRLGSDAFESVAATFEEIVYGERRATRADADAARRGWDEVHRQVDA
ncbi:MAG: DUF4129 domain-containing protein [Actinobacteria bacterium]|nr:DUF4129 domain-containing protein [Actinomycetota bacterium]